MLAVAIVSVAVSGAVAVAAIVAQLWQQRKSLEHDRKLSDLDSVRGIMAEAAAVLHRMEYALDNATATLMGWGAGFFDNEEREAPYRALATVGREADMHKGTLRILFGPEHPVALAFDAATAATLDAYRALGMIKMEPPAEQGTPERREVRAWVEEQRERLETARQNFRVAQDEFVAAAHAAGGARLPPD
ncbi:MAG TPA: hypothetical protein VFS54_00765 [Solirubrobacterales bacterium]|nr:hypothetical protein [Solirubrobacterales bacterium]